MALKLLCHNTSLARLLSFSPSFCSNEKKIHFSRVTSVSTSHRHTPFLLLGGGGNGNSAVRFVHLERKLLVYFPGIRASIDAYPAALTYRQCQPRPNPPLNGHKRRWSHTVGSFTSESGGRVPGCIQSPTPIRWRTPRHWRPEGRVQSSTQAPVSQPRVLFKTVCT